MFDETHSSCEADVDQPLSAYLRAKKRGRLTPPYIPKCNLMPVHKLCKLVLLWNEAGFKKEAGALRAWLSQLEPFLSLWCTDKEYNEQEGRLLFSCLSQIEPIAGGEPDFNLTLLNTSALSAALTLDGRGTSLGMIRGEDVEIRAFGPQSTSLSFGIQGKSLDGWTSVAPFPEVWLEMRHELKEREIKFDFRFIGLKPEMPLSLSFYVKGQSCQIGTETLKPKSLRRFYGESRSVTFENKLTIESSQPHKVQVIPLAGEGCFWDCEFLVSFELHPFASQASFSIVAK